MTFRIFLLTLLMGSPFAFSECHGSPAGFMRLDSPDGQYALVLVQKGDPDDWENRELRVLRGNHELAHYEYEGVLVKAYWLLSRKLVVLDNHNGHAGYGILVVSLDDGSIITSHGTTHSPKYDRGEDMDYLPDLFAAARVQMKQLYKDVDDDHMREGYQSVAIGWTPAQQIKVFARFSFDGLFESQGCVFQVDAELEVTDERRLKWRNVSVREVKSDRNEPQPAEATTLDNLLD